jgi:hypothetical protein
MSKPPISVTLTYDPADMARRGRIGAHRLHATHDSRETTAPARSAFLARFEDEVDPDHTLPDAERQRRAEHARKAYFARLALRSARTRSRKKLAVSAGTETAGWGVGDADAQSPA